jgi:hypothetical protein
LNRQNHSNVCVLFMALSPKAVFSISCVSDEVIPSLKQNLTQIRCPQFCLFLRHQTMDKVQKQNSFNTNTSSSESYRNYLCTICSSSSRRPVWKLFDTPSYMSLFTKLQKLCFRLSGNLVCKVTQTELSIFLCLTAGMRDKQHNLPIDNEFYWKCGKVQIFENDRNKSKLHSERN